VWNFAVRRPFRLIKLLFSRKAKSGPEVANGEPESPDENPEDKLNYDSSRFSCFEFLATISQAFVLVLFLIPITLLVPFAMKVLGLISFIPGISIIIGWLKSGLQEFVVGSLGDIFVVVKDEVQSPGLRDGMIRDLRKIAKNAPDTRIVILAHSTGNLIVYEALAELRTNSGKLERKKELADTRVQDAASPGAVSTPEAREELKREAAEIGELLELERQTIKSIETWVSIGSVMSLAWSTGVVRESNPKYQRPIPTGEEIKWLNLWTTFDIATGAKLAPPDAAPTIPGPMNLRVNNFGSIALDHSGYWDNIEEVYLLLLEELGGRDKSNDFWRGEPVGKSHKRYPRRSEHEIKDLRSRGGILQYSMLLNGLVWMSLPITLVASALDHDIARTIAQAAQLDHIAAFWNLDWFTTATNQPNGMIWWQQIRYFLVTGFGVFALLWGIWYFVMHKIVWNIKISIMRKLRTKDFRNNRPADA
jgi:hypothetical protein